MSKSDKELLELAAKAMGYEVRLSPKDGMAIIIKRKGLSGYWSPILDDNDAFRLSIDLSMNIQHIKNTVKIELPWFGYTSISDCGDDKYAATRRAITLAAAAIGEAME